MKVTITYRNGSQVGPDEYENWTEVIHINQCQTFKEAYNDHFKGKWVGKVNVELHFDPSSDE